MALPLFQPRGSRALAARGLAVDVEVEVLVVDLLVGAVLKDLRDGLVEAHTQVVLPQVWRFALPGLGNVWMVLIKATALISVIQLPELLRNADIAARAVRLPFTFYFAASLMYLAITIVSMLALQRAEVWANRGIRRA